MNDDLGIYLVTDTAQCGPRGVVETVRQAVAGGVHTVQVRDKTAEAANLLKLLIAVADTVGAQARVLLNDRVDVYLAARAHGARVHGVHIGQDDLPPAEARELIGPNAILGLTANTQSHFDFASTLIPGTIDYLGVGVIRASSTKLDHPATLGISGFARLCQSTSLPCVAIGGIERADVSNLRKAGAAGVAIVSALCTAAKPYEEAQMLAQQWGRSVV